MINICVNTQAAIYCYLLPAICPAIRIHAPMILSCVKEHQPFPAQPKYFLEVNKVVLNSCRGCSTMSNCWVVQWDGELLELGQSFSLYCECWVQCSLGSIYWECSPSQPGRHCKVESNSVELIFICIIIWIILCNLWKANRMRGLLLPARPHYPA